MSFASFGVKSFVPDTEVRDFATYLDQGKVMASRCCTCRHVAFPPRSGCSVCGSTEFEWVEIDQTGRLLSYTEVRYGPAGFEGEVPYVLAVAAFPLGVSVFGQMAPELTAQEIEVGMPVRVATRRLRDGRVSYQFVRP